MAITLFNTQSGKKETLKPLQAGKIKMYCCGVTPYGNTHIGHSRTFFSYDLLYRTLVDNHLEVDWARNVTDVDDKIIKKANEEGLSCAEIVDRYVGEQDEMLSHFQLFRPQHEPKVTEHIPQITHLIQKLVDKGLAYANNTGVYYRVRKFTEYGKLSKNKIDDLRQGVRIEVDENKEDALDFALWKLAKPGEIKWPSPWGEGRPGWHVECSAMIHSLYGDSIDIHMGGRDLIFPHHEAEIAQSEGATGKPFSSLWLHAGMVTLYGEKMSKSTNHYVAIADFLSKYPTEVLRLTFLSVSYSQPLDFTMELADQNLKKLAKLYRFVALVDGYAGPKEILGTSPSASTHTTDSTQEFEVMVFGGLDTLVDRMRSSLSDDLNSTAALAVFFEFVKDVNTGLTALEKKGKILNSADRDLLATHWANVKKWFGGALGLLGQNPLHFFESLAKYKLTSELSAAQVEEKLIDRKKARDSKDWAAADRVRDELLTQGIQIQDTPHGTKWTVQL